MSILKSLVSHTKEEALAYHANNFDGGGKIEVISKAGPFVCSHRLVEFESCIIRAPSTRTLFYL